jgi:hypothetical protein
MKRYRLFVITVFLTLGSCTNAGVKSKWKFMGGHHFGDFLSFDNENYQVKNDTLYNGSFPFAIVEDFTRTFIPGTENKLTLKDIKTGELGFYTDKGK